MSAVNIEKIPDKIKSLADAGLNSARNGKCKLDSFRGEIHRSDDWTVVLMKI